MDTGTGRHKTGRALALTLIAIAWQGVAHGQLVVSPTVSTDEATELENKKKSGSFLPGVRSSFSYSTNSNLQDASLSKSGDFILEVTPYVTAQSEAARLKYKVDYSISNLYRIRTGDSILGRQRLSGNVTASLAGDWLWVDAAGTIANTYADLFAPLSSDPNLAFVNSAQIRSFSLSPFVRSRFAGLVDATFRYGLQYTDASRNVPEQSKLNHTASVNFAGTESDGQNWNWSWGGEYQLRKFGNVNVARKFSSGSIFWVPTPSVRLSGTAAFDQIDGLLARNGDRQGFGGGFGIDWNPLDKTNISMQALKRYYGTSGKASISHYSNWLLLSANYSKGVTGSVDSSVFSIDPTASLGTGPVTSNPVYQSLIAQNLRLGYGIPYAAGIIEDTYIQQQQVGATLGLIGIRNALTFNAFASQRDSSLFVKAVPAGGSGPRGGGVGISGTYTGIIRIYSASLDYSYKFDARSTLSASLTGIRTEAPTTSYSSRSYSLSTGISSLLTPDTKIGAGIRRTDGRAQSLTFVKFDDTAVYGSLDVRF